MVKTSITENNTNFVEEEFKDTRSFKKISKSHMNMGQQFRKWKQECHSSEDEDDVVSPMANVSFKFAMNKYDTKKLEKGKNKRKAQGMKFKSEDNYVLK
jgi:hypothetical protein